MAKGNSVHLGLNGVDADHYQGWDGRLEACEFDANDMEAIASSAGFETRKLLTAQATRKALQQAFRRAISSLRNGDMFLVSYSGHGGQLPDANGDETDYRDETWCLYDGEWLDDETYALLRQFRPGVRILIVSDSCHSGTVYKNAVLTRNLELRRALPTAVDTRDLGRYRAMPNRVATETYRANKKFYDQIQSNDELKAARGQLRATVMLLSACQDYELAAEVGQNGVFTSALKSVWDDGVFRGSYIDLHAAIRTRVANSDQVPRLDLEGVMSNSFERQTPFSIEGRQAMQNTEQPSPSPWRWGIRTQQREREQPTTAASLREGAYVTAVGSGNALFRVQNGRRRPIDPADLESMGVTQSDIQEVDSLLLRSIPLDVTRAVGRDVQTYLWSDLRSGHFMQSWVWVQGTTLTLRTITETVTWFGGYTGGVSVLLFDANGALIQYDPIRYRYGVDGRAFGSGLRDETETTQLVQNVADATESVLVLHYWDPKVDLVAAAIVIGRFIWEIIQIIIEAQQEGEPVNAGGEEF